MKGRLCSTHAHDASKTTHIIGYIILIALVLFSPDQKKLRTHEKVKINYYTDSTQIRRIIAIIQKFNNYPLKGTKNMITIITMTTTNTTIQMI